MLADLEVYLGPPFFPQTDFHKLIYLRKWRGINSLPLFETLEGVKKALAPAYFPANDGWAIYTDDVENCHLCHITEQIGCNVNR